MTFTLYVDLRLLIFSSIDSAGARFLHGNPASAENISIGPNAAILPAPPTGIKARTESPKPRPSAHRRRVARANPFARGVSTEKAPSNEHRQTSLAVPPDIESLLWISEMRQPSAPVFRFDRAGILG